MDRKKYFSPVERLRITQQHHTEQREKQQPKRSWLAPASPSTATGRPTTSPGLGASSVANSFNDPLISAKQKHISEDQARWFLTLPEKIRRQQFSRDEQINLVIRCKKVLESASPDLASDAYRRCCSDSRRHSRTTLLSKDRPSTSAGTHSLDGTRSFLDLDSASVQTTDTSSAAMKIFKLYSRRSRSLSADQIQAEAPVAPPSLPVVQEPPVSPTPRKRPFRRFSLTPIPLPPPTLAPAPVPAFPTSPSTNAFKEARPVSVAASLSARLSRPYIEFFSSDPQPLPSPTSESRSYHDEDIRKQLRRTLMSPETFDEALEFGFETKQPSPPPSVSTRHLLFPQSHFSDDECEDDEEIEGGPAELDANEDFDFGLDDSTSILEPASPRTPTPPLAEPSPIIKLSSFDSAIGGLPLYAPFRPWTITRTLSTSSKPRAFTTIENREMTIHMSLTRPDLRSISSTEEELYSVQRQQTSGVGVEKNDPLALQALSVCEDDTGMHGAFAVPESGLGSFGRGRWKVFKGLKMG